MEGEREMWKALGIDLKRNDEFLEAASQIYGDVYMKQPNRPKGMDYFDFVMSEVHSIRPKEMVDHRKKGGKVVGTFCVYVPDEIIFAANGIAVGLCCGSDFSFVDADDILPANLCPLIKSGMGFKKGMLSPYFEACDFLVGETTCDGKKKVYEILDNYCMPTYIMEVPQKKDPEQRNLWLKEVELFKEKMEKEAGVEITPEVLGEKIKLINARRKVLERLYNLRKNSPAPISGKDALLVSQIAFYDDPERFTSKVDELCDELEERVKNGEGVAEPTAPRILVSGCPMVMPNWKLHHIVETNGAIVACEETCTGTRYFDTPCVDETPTDINGQLEAIADRYLNIKCSCFTPNDDRVEQIVKFARDYKAAGVIYYTLQFCLAYNVEYEKVKRALNKEGIPLLKIETDYSQEDTGQLTTRIEGFLERISLNSGL